MSRLQPARHGARRSEARVLRFLPRESERSGAQVRYTRNQHHQVRARAETWEHCLAAMECGFSLVQRPSMEHGATGARGMPPFLLRKSVLPRARPGPYFT